MQTLTGHTDKVTSVAVSPDGTIIASGSYDETIRVWDIETGKTIQVLKGHTTMVNSVAFFPDGKWVVSGSTDNTVRVWDLKTGETIRIFNYILLVFGKPISMNPILSVTVSPDGKKVVTGAVTIAPELISDNSYGNAINIWDIDSEENNLVLPGHTDGVNSVAVSPDGKKIVSGSNDSTIMVWDFESGRTILVLDEHEGRVGSVAISPDGKKIVSSSIDKTIKIWDIETGENIQTLISSHVVLAARVCPDNKTIVSGGSAIRIWDLKTGKILKTLNHPDCIFRSIAISPDGSKIISGTWDNFVRIWDLKNGQGYTKRRELMPV